MKFLVILAAYTAFCAGNAIPHIPGDNSHYVNGESRFIWIPDNEGIPQLVDLEEPINHAMLNSRNGANNQYWLFTRNNPNNAQVIVHGDANTIWNSNYVASGPLKVIVHGWNTNGNSEMNPLITSAFLDVTDANVIVVDWRDLANGNYLPAAYGVSDVGLHLGSFLVWLIDTTGGDWNKVHLVGFSLGAHVIASASRTAGRRPARLTGLDPAGPLFEKNPEALNSYDGQYVEAIHTDGGVFGVHDPIGNANFYPNGGRHPQPGCLDSTCSHGRATELFASSVRFNHFVGRQCGNIWEAELSFCNGATFNMGNSDLSKRGVGIYGLLTESSWPY